MRNSIKQILAKNVLCKETISGDPDRAVSFNRTDVADVCMGLEAIEEVTNDIMTLQDTSDILNTSPQDGATDSTLELAGNLVHSAVEKYDINGKQVITGTGAAGTYASIEGIGDFVGGIFKSMNEGMRDLKDRAIMATETSIHDAASVVSRAKGIERRTGGMVGKRNGKYDRRVFIAHFTDKSRNPVITADRLKETIMSFGASSKAMLSIAIAARSVFEIKPNPIDFDRLIKNLPADDANKRLVSLTGNAGFYGVEYALGGVQGHASTREELINSMQKLDIGETTLWINGQLQCKSLDGMEPHELQESARALAEAMTHVISALTEAKADFDIVLRYLDFNKTLKSFNDELEDYVANTEEGVRAANRDEDAQIDEMSTDKAPNQDKHVHPEAYKAFFKKQIGILHAMVSTQMKISIANIQAGAALVDYLEWCAASK